MLLPTKLHHNPRRQDANLASRLPNEIISFRGYARLVRIALRVGRIYPSVVACRILDTMPFEAFFVVRDLVGPLLVANQVVYLNRSKFVPREPLNKSIGLTRIGGGSCNLTKPSSNLDDTHVTS